MGGSGHSCPQFSARRVEFELYLENLLYALFLCLKIAWGELAFRCNVDNLRLECFRAVRIGREFDSVAKAQVAEVVKAPGLVLVGALWMSVHAGAVLAAWRLLRVPIFFPAVASQANVGGAASAPIVAAAFNPALAPAGILLAVAGYVLGTYAALLCAFLLERVHLLVFV